MKKISFTLGPRGKKVLKALGLFGITIVCLCLISALALGAIGLGVYSYVFSKFEPETVKIKTENIAISEKAPQTKMKHIAVFGIDTDGEGTGRSDTIMIFTVDQENKQLKLSSILRDSYVSVKGHDQDKINHAFAYGGAELALHTINSNFNMNISEYVALDFRDFVQIIDMLGGVDLELTAQECEQINLGAKFIDPSAGTVPLGGNVHLNGAQAITYSRIRKIDSEVERTARQRRLIQQLAYKLKNQNLTDYPKLIRDFLPLMETSLTEGELLNLAMDVLACDPDIKQYTLPGDADEPWGGTYDGFWCWRFDIPAAAQRWHNFLKTKVE